MMSVALRAENGDVHEVFGSNILPGFPVGTNIVGLSVNGTWFDDAFTAAGTHICISLSRIRRALLEGAPTKAPVGSAYGVFA